ncbi:hypothetical protein [Noviherbaspirillum malthae]|uniref:hypothetical protein n=1 Tax=Noviherbaspirillum malthae TaxID=1260987 RepID=UPI00188E642E|nr:hypothetical protein [Noviherbaspirillum malthae]
MRVIHDRYSDRSAAPALLVLLPGAMQQPEDLLSAGFAAAVRARGLPIDLALVDLGPQFIGETGNGTIVRQLHEMLQQQIALHAYQHIWIAGISIGGAIAAAYADTYAAEASSRIRGLCLLAPYPGSRMIIKAIREAGGLAHWSPEQSADMDDSAFRLWRWLKHYRNTGPRLYLGYGLQDRFTPGLALMAEAVDANCLATIPGGHDLPAWQRLWETFLNRWAPALDPNTERA